MVSEEYDGNRLQIKRTLLLLALSYGLGLSFASGGGLFLRHFASLVRVCIS